MEPQKVILSNRDYLSELKTQHRYLGLSSSVLNSLNDSLTLVEQKLGSEELKLALVGGFSAGKSTLINALLGEKILTSRINPTTICPTFISYGDEPRVQITFTDGSYKSSAKTGAAINAEIRIMGECLPLVAISPELYKTVHHFSRPGYYEYTLVINGKPHQKAVLKAPEDFDVEFYYHLISNEVSTSLTYFHVPEDKLPCVQIRGLDYEGEFILRDMFLSGKFRALVNLPPGDYRLELVFDGEGFLKMYPKRPQARSQQAWWKRLWAKIVGSSATKQIDVEVPHVQPIHCKVQSAEEPLVIEFDPIKCTFYTEEGPKSDFVRTFSMTSEEDKAIIPQIISAYTAASRVAGQQDYSGLVRRVDVYYPSPMLANQLTIVDTPGVSAEHEHSAITLDVLKNTADACLFLYPADQAGTMSDLAFIKDHVDNLSGVILFAITKIDLAENMDEVEEILEVIGEKITEQTGINEPTLFALSPLQALINPQGEEGIRFYQYMRTITELMVDNREAILVRSLLKVQETVMEQIKATAKEKRQEYNARLQELRSYVIEDLDSFISKQQPGIYRTLEELFDRDRYIDQFSIRLYDVARDHKARMRNKVQQATDKEQIKTFCEEGILPFMENFNSDFSRASSDLNRHFSRTLTQVATDAFSEFEASFEEQYSLKRLTGKPLVFSLGELSNFNIHASASATVNKAIETSNAAFGWGMGAGAVIGTMLLPGIGTIIGGFAGSFLGSLFGPSLDQVKSETILKIAQGIDSQLENDIMPSIEKMVDEQQRALTNAVLRMVSRYLDEYSIVVDEMIEEHQALQKEVAIYIQKAEEVVYTLGARQQELTHLDTKLREAMVIKRTEHLGHERLAVS
jgi:GTPase Era involved in 16S rRNA processing/gas vesicle protein